MNIKNKVGIALGTVKLLMSKEYRKDRQVWVHEDIVKEENANLYMNVDRDLLDEYMKALDKLGYSKHVYVREVAYRISPIGIGYWIVDEVAIMYKEDIPSIVREEMNKKENIAVMYKITKKKYDK